MKRNGMLFDSQFLTRFTRFKFFIFLGICLSVGTMLSAVSVKVFNLLSTNAVSPLLFSGIPSAEDGFVLSFTTLLLNLLIGLIVLFLLGITAFGAIGIPVFLLFKGASIGIGVLSFLSKKTWTELLLPTVSYIPAAAATSLLLILFAVRALAFSNALTKVSFYSHQEQLNFYLYFTDLLCFLCFSVCVALIGAVLAVFGGKLL